MDDVIERLESIHLFGRLSEAELWQVARLFNREARRRGEVLCRQGEADPTLYVIDSGQVVIRQVNRRGVEQTLEHLGPGDYFGETSLLTGEIHDATVQAVDRLHLFTLSKSDFDEFVEQRPHIQKKLDVRPKTREKLQARDFPGRHDDETPLAYRRKHWMVLVRFLTTPLLLLLISLLSSWLIGRLSSVPFRLLIVVQGGLIVLISLWSVYRVIDWWNDYYIVTNKRVIHIEKVLFFSEERMEAPIEKIQNVNVITHTPFEHFLGYQHLVIQTASEGKSIRFDHVPKAEQLRDVIFEQIERTWAQAGLEERRLLEQGLRDRLRGEAEPDDSLGDRQKEDDSSQRGTAPPLSQVVVDLLTAVFRSFWPRMWERDGDTITWRKHWFILIQRIRRPGVTLLFLSAVLVAWRGGLGPLERLSQYTSPWIMIPFLLGTLFWLWWRYEDWRNDIYVLTETQVLDIDRLPFHLREESRQATLDTVQNVSYLIPNVLAEFVDYGNVLIETAGATGRLTFDFVYKPREVQREIFDHIEAFRERQRRQEARRRREEIADAISVYHGMRNEENEEG